MKVINILVLEDDHLDTMDLVRTLDKMNIMYKITIAKNGEEGIVKLKEMEPKLPDVVLIDINMPRMNGFEFLETVRSTESWKNLKCFILTTSKEEVEKNTARKHGVSGYIIKPLKLSNPSSMDAFNLMIDLMNMKE